MIVYSCPHCFVHRFIRIFFPVGMALSLIEHEDLDKLPDGELSSSIEHGYYPASLVQVLRVTNQAKCNLIKVSFNVLL